MHTSEQNNQHEDSGKYYSSSAEKKRRNVFKERRKIYEQIENGELDMWRNKK